MCYVLGTYEKENIPYRSIVRAEWSGADSLQPGSSDTTTPPASTNAPATPPLDKQIRHPASGLPWRQCRKYKPPDRRFLSGLFFILEKGNVRHPCIRGMIDLSFCARFSLGLFGKPIKVSLMKAPIYLSLLGTLLLVGCGNNQSKAGPRDQYCDGWKRHGSARRLRGQRLGRAQNTAVKHH